MHLLQTSAMPTAPPLRTRTAYGICQAAGWGAWFLAYLYTASSDLSLASVEPADAGVALASTLLGLGLSHAWRGTIRRRGWLRLTLAQGLSRLVVGALVLGVAWCYVILVGEDVLFSGRPLAEAATGLFDGLFGFLAFFAFQYYAAAFLIWTLLYAGAAYFAAYQQAQVEQWRLAAAATEAELRALRAQLDPHFLFNALNGLRGLIAEAPERAQHALTQLAALLRYALQAGARTAVPLADELDVVRAYLDLEQIRLEDRLRVRLDVDAEALAAPVPPLLVQTLVENAVRHGIAPRRGGGLLTLEATREAGRVRLIVTNPGHLLTPAADDGLGLRSTVERLRLLCGEAASLTLRAHGDDVVRAEVVLPLPAPTVPA